MKLIWLTDLHLDFLQEDERMGFYAQVVQADGDAVLISGDIADALSLDERLQEIAFEVNRPIYFVLGNHDFYHGKVSTVHKETKRLTQQEFLLNWLSVSGPKKLGKQTCIVGVDSWADARYGDYAGSLVSLNDSRYIQELAWGKIFGRGGLQKEMQKLADEDAALLKKQLLKAVRLDSIQQVIVVVHIPPFQEACLYQDQPTTDAFLPFFSSKATGDAILEAAKENPEIQFLVLCGHTHCSAYCQPAHNIVCRTGGTDYMRREVEEVEI